MGRKDRERFQRLREANPNYVGYRGLDSPTMHSPSLETETVSCSVCQRKRNVAVTDLPEDIDAFVCMSCRENTTGSL